MPIVSNASSAKGKRYEFKKVIFVSQEPGNPSERMLGFRVIALLRRWKIVAEVMELRDVRLSELRDSVILLVKKWPAAHVDAWRSNRNIVIVQLSDLIATDKLHTVVRLTEIDCLLFPSKRALKDYSYLFPNARMSEVLAHFWDDRFRPNRSRSFRLGFLGTNVAINWEQHIDNIPDLEVIPPDEQLFRNALHFSCHYSVRLHGTLSYLYKPQSKLFTAVACNANIIASRDEGFVELLNEYPFYTDGSYSDVMAKVDQAKTWFGGSRWRDSLELLGNLRHEHAPEAFCRSLFKFVCRAWATRFG